MSHDGGMRGDDDVTTKQQDVFAPCDYRFQAASRDDAEIKFWKAVEADLEQRHLISRWIIMPVTEKSPCDTDKFVSFSKAMRTIEAYGREKTSEAGRILETSNQ